MAMQRLTTGETHDQRRLFRCGKCTVVAGVEGFTWSRRFGIYCRHCRRHVYVLAERGRSPYLHWPHQHEPPLSDDEALSLMEEARDDGMLFLSLEDLRYYEQIMARRGRDSSRRVAWPSSR